MSDPIYYPSNNKKNTIKESKWDSVEKILCVECEIREHHVHNAYNKKIEYKMCHKCFFKKSEENAICLLDF